MKLYDLKAKSEVGNSEGTDVLGDKFRYKKTTIKLIYRKGQKGSDTTYLKVVIRQITDRPELNQEAKG